MKKLLLSTLLLFILMTYSDNTNAQVSGLSYTLSPYGEYILSGEDSGLANGILGGAELGMGFGQFVELRGNYAQGFGLMTDISNFGFRVTEEQILNYTQKDVDITRYGGEIKLNLSKGALLPYLSLGTGIQSIGMDSMSTSKQIYLNAGLGVKISAGDRYTIGLQAINTRYNYSAVNSLLDDAERQSFGLVREDFLADQVSQWSARASLVLYIGGRKPGQITDIDEAYWDNFSGGFRGLNVPVEFQVSKMNFHEDLPFRDTYMAGGSAGLNFGPLVGVRGFYWRGIEEGTTTSPDDLAMYGGEARFKLNEGKGFTPWLTIGAGNIHVGDDYVGNPTDSIATTPIDSRGFAMGGLGMDLPFSKYVKATGFVRTILTTNQDFEDLTQPEEIKTSWNYGVSLNFVIGRNKKDIEVIKQSAFDEYILSSDAANAEASQELKSQYEDKIKVLKGQLNEAISAQDAKAVDEINAEREKTLKIIDQLNKNAYSNPQGQSNPAMQVTPSGGSEIRMTPAEFNLLLRDIMDGMNKSNPQGAAPTNNGGSTTEMQSALSDFKKEQQISQLDKELAEIKLSLNNISNAQSTLKDNNNEISNKMSSLSDKMGRQLEKLETNLAKNKSDLESLKNRQIQIEASPTTGATREFQSFESEQLQRDIDFTNEKIDALKEAIMTSLSEMQANNYQPIAQNNLVDVDNSPTKVSNKNKIQTAEDYDNSTGIFSKLRYNGMSGFAGFNVGGNTTFNLGYRLHYKIDSTKFEFVPETFFGFGSPSSFGISANGMYHLDFITKSPIISPYVGLGLGFMKVGDDMNADKLTGAWNFIIGTSLNVSAGDLYVDFTARNGFNYNQLIVGYRFPF